MSFYVIADLTRDSDTALQYLRLRQCIRRSAACTRPGCGRAMTEVRTGRVLANGQPKVMWRCPTHKGSKIGLREGSFWEDSNLPFNQLLLLAYEWAYQTPINKVVEKLDISETTVIDWYQLFRDVCSNHLVNNPRQIGGPGHTVQIDETCIAKRMFHQGRMIPPQWLFGGIDTETQETFILLVPNRNRDTLEDAIEEYILPDTRIHSDGWAAYLHIDQMLTVNGFQAYEHATVNHSVNFVNPADGTHTNGVERYWRTVKKPMRTANGWQGTTRVSHFDEGLWRRRFAPTCMAGFDNLLTQISLWYPTP